MDGLSSEPTQVAGRIKWFDQAKGFGFIISDLGGPDILLHSNVLRAFGRTSVADGAHILVKMQFTPRGAQAVEVLSIDPPADPRQDSNPILAELEGLEVSGPFQPARVKWFDRGKGFGFANVFGSREDIFVHAEILRMSGLADLLPGEAIALRVADGRRGKLAVEVAPWESVL